MVGVGAIDICLGPIGSAILRLTLHVRRRHGQMIGGLCIEFPIHHAVQQSRHIDIDLLITIRLAVGFDSRRQIGVEEEEKHVFLLTVVEIDIRGTVHRTISVSTAIGAASSIG